MTARPLPADSHVHSEFSWDTGGPSSAAVGTMERTCAKAVEIGLPVVIFTEHLDVSGFHGAREDFYEQLGPLVNEHEVMQPPLLDLGGYLEGIDRCRRRFPELRILTGAEFGQPHLDGNAARELIDFSLLDRLNGSLHTLPHPRRPGTRSEPPTLYRELDDPDEVIWAYLAEVPAMLEGDFDVFTHLDYAARYWPAQAPSFDVERFEDGYRQAMRAIAGTGRPLEMNTGHGLREWIPRWWVEEGGRAVTFGSDDHETTGLARGFPAAIDLLASLGFGPGSRPEDPWTR